MICPRCKKEMNDDMNFCPQCGMKVEKCPICHQPIMIGAKFCSHCGTSLNPYHQQSHIGGYYQPLSDVPPQPQTHKTEEETITFQDVHVSRKINKKVIVIAVVILVAISSLSYYYLYYGPSLNNQITQNNQKKDLPKTNITIETTTSFATHTGNINQDGHVAQSEKTIYIIDDNGYIVSMNTDLENQKTIVREQSQCLNVVGETIYYTNSKNQLCQVSTNGDNQKVLIDQAVYYVIAKEDKIYYQLDESGKEHIYVYDIQTEKASQLNERNSYCLNVLDNDIYFTSTEGIYHMGIDGKGEEKLLSDKVYNLIYQNGLLYYMTSKGEIMSYDVKSRETKTLMTRTKQLINITDQYIFYLNDTSDIVRYDISSMKTKKIYRGNMSAAYVIGDKLIINAFTTSYKEEKYKIITDFDGNEQQRLFVKDSGNYI